MILDLAERMLNGLFALIPRRTPTAQALEQVKLIAHRGAHNHRYGVIENTLEAFARAKKAGCWGLELDVHATADGVLVVHHDATLARLWGHEEAIAALSFDALRARVPEIPSLAEVVQQFGDMHLFIELKAPFKETTALAQTLKGLTAGKEYHLLTLDPSIIEALPHFPRQALLLVAVHHNVDAFCRLSIKEHLGGVLGNYLLLTDAQIKRLKEAQQAYGVGFVNSKNSLYREVDRGITWLFTDNAKAVGACLK